MDKSPMDSDNTSTSQDNLMPSRLKTLAVFGAAVLLLMGNHYLAVMQGVIYMFIVWVAPLTAMIALGGIVDPRIFWSLTAQGVRLPTKFKVIGVCLGLVGGAITVFLMKYVYIDPKILNHS